MITKLGIIILFFVLIFYLNRVNLDNDLETLDSENNIYNLEKKYRNYYSKIKMQDLFDKYPKSPDGLTFGYICPGAMKTIDYLNKQKVGSEITKLVNNLKILTDFQFFIEIIVIYADYVKHRKLLNSLKKKLDKKGCHLSKKITSEITNLFKQIKNKDTKLYQNIPDDFYHIRHNTLICSSDKKLATDRINLLKNLYQNKKEGFFNIDNCLGRRDGVSGCRDCCRNYQDYNQCVSNCMNY